MRLLTASGFAGALALLGSGVAAGAERVPVHVYSALEQRLMAASRSTLEERYPKGSRAYYYDYYEIDDGPDSVSVTVDTAFHRDSRGVLHATDINSGYAWTFSPRATIERKNDEGEEVLRPGEVPGLLLRELLDIGGARLGKILS